MMGYINKSFLVIGILAFSVAVQAQDTIRKRSVEVTSQFKPVLKDAAKINLNASPPTADTTRPRLQYQIPNQNLHLLCVPNLFCWGQKKT